MNNSPSVSIGLPVYNGELYLQEAVDSILGQSYQDLELIISDNCSTDNTEEICRYYTAKDRRVRYFRNLKNLGASWNYNRVFELARGKYFKWAAHDDRICPEYIQQCVEILEGNPSLALCTSKTGRIDENGQNTGEYHYPMRTTASEPHVRFRDLILVNHNCTDIFGLIPRQVLALTHLIGTFVGSDRVLLAELGLMGPFAYLDDLLFLRRNHPQTSVRKYDEYERLVWFDPQKNGKIYLPNWNIGREYLSCIRRVRLSAKERFLCSLVMVLWYKNMRDRLFRDLSVATHKILARSQNKGRVR